jgi:sulfite exporter TauE/SafE
MLGFGVGTSPAVMGAGFVIPLLTRHAKSLWPRRAVGLTIIMIEIFRAILPPGYVGSWCGIG